MNTSKFFDPSTKRGRLRRFCLMVFEQHREEGTIPTTVKFVHYEAVSAGVVQKKDPNNKRGRRSDQDISEAITSLRKEGYIEDWEVEDRTRRAVNYAGCPCPIAEALPNVVESMRLCPWGSHKPHLIVESESLAGLLNKYAYEYRLVVSPLRGQSSRSFIRNEIAPLFDLGFDHVLFLGDCDKAGDDIKYSAAHRIVECCDVHDWETLALTREQVDAYNLPWIERKDGRDGITRQVCETEATPQRILINVVINRLDELLPVKLSTIERREKKQRQAILKKLAE